MKLAVINPQKTKQPNIFQTDWRAVPFSAMQSTGFVCFSFWLHVLD